MEKELQVCVELYAMLRKRGYDHRSSLIICLEAIISVVANGNDASVDAEKNNKDIEDGDE